MDFTTYATWWVRRGIGVAMDETTRGHRRPDMTNWTVGDGTDNLSYALIERLSAEATFDDTSDNAIDEDDLPPFEQAAFGLELSAVRAQLARLKPEERTVVESHFGLDTTPRTVGELSRELDTPAEQVREIEELALSKMRHPSVARLWAHQRLDDTGS